MTPSLTGFLPDSLAVGRSAHPLSRATQQLLGEFARTLGWTGWEPTDVGLTWFGSARAITQAAECVISSLQHLLEDSFLPEAARQGLDLGEWLEDFDWDAHRRIDSSEGLSSWNVALSTEYAADLCFGQAVKNWQWYDDIVLAHSAAAKLDMAAVAVVSAAPAGSGWDVAAMLENTLAFCKRWAAGGAGRPGSALHFMGLISCQASQREVPEGELRYAATLT